MKSNSAKLGLAAVLLAAFQSASLHGADIIKQDNTDSLDLTSSWVDLAIPTSSDVAVWDNTVTASNAVLLGANSSWSGIRISNPGGAVSIGAGNTLTLGREGINMSAATQGLTLGAVTSLANTTQTWNTGSQALGVTSFTRSGGSTINMITSGGGSINIGSGTASANLGVFAILNSSHYAALDASKNVTTATYSSYTLGGNLSGTYSGILNVTGTATNSTQAWRNSNPLTVSSGVRFGVDNAQNTKWTVDTSSSGRLLTTPSILVGSEVTQNVEFNGSGGIRPASSGGDLLVQNYGTGSLIFNTVLNNGNPTATNLVVTGTGNVIIASTSAYTGTTRIQGGILQIGNNGAAGTLGSGSVVNDGTLRFNRTDSPSVSNSITGSGRVVQSGAGNVTLSAVNNAYTGGTVVESGSITFSNSFTLSGANRINVTGAANPVVGTDHGAILATGGNFNYGGMLTILISGTAVNGASYDLFNLSGATQGGTFSSISIGGSYAIAASAPVAGVWSGTASGLTFTFTEATGDLLVSAIPEPSAFALLAGVLGLGFAATRRRRSA